MSGLKAVFFRETSFSAACEAAPFVQFIFQPHQPFKDIIANLRDNDYAYISARPKREYSHVRTE
jgi:hypothetical protein